jgi:hypothetical protein
MLTFIRGMLSDFAMQQLISSLMLSNGETSSGWLLVEIGERYIQARLVTTTLHKTNRIRQSSQIHFYIKILSCYSSWMQWCILVGSATLMYNKTPTFQTMSLPHHQGLPTLLPLASSWPMRAGLCYICTYHTQTDQSLSLITSVPDNGSRNSHWNAAFISFWCGCSAEKTLLHSAISMCFIPVLAAFSPWTKNLVHFNLCKPFFQKMILVFEKYKWSKMFTT